MSTSYESFINTLFSKAEKNGIPLSGSFEITSRCNLDCKMCYIHCRESDAAAASLEKPAGWWLSLAKNAKDRGMLLALITGGEPLLRPDFSEIYLGLKSMGLLVSINTNGTLISEKEVELFKSFPPQRINISLYGTSEEAYNRLCGNGKAYFSVTNAVKSLVSAGVPVKLNYTVNPLNVGEGAGIWSFANEMGVPVQPTFYMFPPVRCVKCDTLRLSPRDAAKAQLEWHRRRLGENTFKEVVNHLNFTALRESEPECGERIACRAGSASFWVTWKGELTPCGMMNSPSVTLDSPEAFNAAWDEIRGEREKIHLPKECSACDLRAICDVCAAVTSAESGKFDGIPRYVCEKAKSYGELIKGFKNM